MNVRQGDPPNFDPRDIRRVDPGQWVAELGWGRWSLRLYSYAFLFAVIGLAIVGTNIWAMREIESAIDRLAKTSTREHVINAVEDRKTRCIIALAPEQRTALLADRYPGAWGRACWWMQSDVEAPY